MLGNFVVLFASIFAILSMDNIDGGMVGLSITQALTVSIHISMKNVGP